MTTPIAPPPEALSQLVSGDMTSNAILDQQAIAQLFLLGQQNNDLSSEEKVRLQFNMARILHHRAKLSKAKVILIDQPRSIEVLFL